MNGKGPALDGAPARRVVVGLLTYRRPVDLAAVLPMVVQQAAAVVPPATVLVVDNDPEASARATVDGLALPAVRYVHEPAPGIAAGRNRALDECAHDDLLVFIDDDERPVDGWLQMLLDTYDRERPAGVVGPVVSEFAQPPERWLTEGQFFRRRRLPTGTSVDIAATNNLLLDLHVLRHLGLRFDERFGISGGSDMLLTRQLTGSGGRLVWCDEAVVTDVVPPQRLTRSWVLRRAYRSGNTWARTSIVLAPDVAARTAVRARVGAQGLVRLAGGGGRWLLGEAIRSTAHRARGLRTAARGAGMVLGVVGGTYEEYRRQERASLGGAAAG